MFGTKRKEMRGRVKGLVDDLTSLEINTIRRADLTGESMPDARHALFDIAVRYNTALNDLLDGDLRETTGVRVTADGTEERSVLQARFTKKAYRRGDAVMVAITLKDARGLPRAGEPIRAMVRPAPTVRPTGTKGGALVRMQPSEKDPATLFEARADGHGSAFLLLSVPKEARAGVCVEIEAAGIELGMEIPVTQVRGDLATFHYLNRRTNEAPDRSHWLVRRIELNTVLIATILQAIPDPAGGGGCDANDHSRRCLNGAEEGMPKPAPLRLNATELVRIRKIWELSCEQIVMQTVVQLDGDVVTRISGDIESIDHQLIHALHADGVRVATQSWQFLVETLVGFTRSLVGWFTR